MIKHLTIYICMLLVLFQSFSKWAVLLQFEMNRDYIAKNLCVNRNTPSMHCNGKCHLAKKMQEESKETSMPSSSWSKFAFEEMVPGSFISFTLTRFNSKNVFPPHYATRIIPGVVNLVFRPPSC